MMKFVLILPLLLTACGAQAAREKVLTQPAALIQPSPRASLSQPHDADRASTLVQEKMAARPADVERCLEKTEVKGEVFLRTDKKHYFLKGDFDGDNLPDQAVAVKGRQTLRNGVLICTGQGETVILGADNPIDPPFSNMPHDNFVAPKWKIYMKEQALELRDPEKDPPAQVASPQGDSIAMIWEDGVCLIYWDGTRYRWGCGQ
jgi:hypothetical protein